MHEFGRSRLERMAWFVPGPLRKKLGQTAERHALDATLRFYRLGRTLLAPNAELVRMLEEHTGKPAYLMQRGVDTSLYDPDKRARDDDAVVIGYVGRLSAEKNVRLLAEVARGLREARVSNFRFLVVGQGNELGWLRENLNPCDFPGVLSGEHLASAYASMDIFAFPSTTDTFGNVVLEALASGVPPVVTNAGGPKYLVHHGITGLLSANDAAFVKNVRTLASDPYLRSQMSIAARRYATLWEFPGMR